MKMDKKYWAILLLLVVIFGGLFFWFQWRPTRIKHECSWIKQHSDFNPGISVEQTNKNNSACLNYKQNHKPVGMFDLLFFCSTDAKPVPAQPAKDWWRPASSKEYDFCIHDKGL